MPHHGDGTGKAKDKAQKPYVVLLGLHKALAAVKPLRRGVRGNDIQPHPAVSARMGLITQGVQQGRADALPPRLGGNTDAVDQEVVVIDLAGQQTEEQLAPKPAPRAVKLPQGLRVAHGKAAFGRFETGKAQQAAILCRGDHHMIGADHVF